jgi:tRNA pseudouridine55 synthase
VPSGIILVDKPEGWTSNRATRRVQRLFGARAAGHLGTLDPFATGLLPVMLDDATRLGPWLAADEKTYLAEAALGTATDTLDRDGDVTTRRDVPADSRARLVDALPRFVGRIRQRVPDYSAAKVRGVRRCDLARAGRSAQAAEKEVDVRSLRLLEFRAGVAGAGPPRAVLEVACGPGTYVRQLVADLGEAIGCGAYTVSLRRTRAGPFGIDEAVAVGVIESTAPDSRVDLLVPLRGRLPGPTWEAGEAERSALSRGRPVPWVTEGATVPVVFVTDGARLIAVGRVDDGRLHPRRVFAGGGIALR